MEKDQCRKLIELYGNYKPLWDPKHPDYTNKGLRENSWKNISANMNLPVADLKKKMDSLLGAYRRERSREKQSRITGSGRDYVYVSKWHAYECFQFMADKNNPGETQDTLQNVQDQTQPDDSGGDKEGQKEPSGVQMENEKSLEQCRKKRKRTTTNIKTQEDDRINDAFKILKDCVHTSADPLLIYGQHIANELRKYDPITLAHVKNAINNIIFEADIGKFQQYNTGYFTHSYAEGRSYTPLCTTSPSADSSITDARNSTSSPQTLTNSSVTPPVACSPEPTTSSLPPCDNNF